MGNVVRRDTMPVGSALGPVKHAQGAVRYMCGKIHIGVTALGKARAEQAGRVPLIAHASATWRKCAYRDTNDDAAGGSAIACHFQINVIVAARELGLVVIGSGWRTETGVLRREIRVTEVCIRKFRLAIGPSDSNGVVVASIGQVLEDPEGDVVRLIVVHNLVAAETIIGCRKFGIGIEVPPAFSAIF